MERKRVAKNLPELVNMGFPFRRNRYFYFCAGSSECAFWVPSFLLYPLGGARVAKQGSKKATRKQDWKRVDSRILSRLKFEGDLGGLVGTS